MRKRTSKDGSEPQEEQEVATQNTWIGIKCLYSIGNCQTDCSALPCTPLHCVAITLSIKVSDLGRAGMTGMEGMKEEKKERKMVLELSTISSKLNKLCI